MADNHDELDSSSDFLRNLMHGDAQLPDLLEDEPLLSAEHDLAEMLRDRCRRLLQPQSFVAGDLVMWKPGLRNKRYPRPGKPAVVVEVLANPVLDPKAKVWSIYYREPLDIVLGVIAESGPLRGDFIYWHFDSRRFQRWQPREK